jgi:hypothetical protein
MTKSCVIVSIGVINVLTLAEYLCVKTPSLLRERDRGFLTHTQDIQVSKPIDTNQLTQD